MRFYEGDYAYEIERIRDSATQLYVGWRYNVYRVRPDNKLLRSGQTQSQTEAEALARKILDSVRQADANPETATSSDAA